MGVAVCRSVQRRKADGRQPRAPRITRGTLGAIPPQRVAYLIRKIDDPADDCERAVRRVNDAANQMWMSEERHVVL